MRRNPLKLSFGVMRRQGHRTLNAFFDPQGVAEQSPGLVASFATYPGSSVYGTLTLEGLCTEPDTQPFQGWGLLHSGPRVVRKKRGQPWALLHDPLGVGRPCGRFPIESVTVMEAI